MLFSSYIKQMNKSPEDFKQTAIVVLMRYILFLLNHLSHMILIGTEQEFESGYNFNVGP